MLKFSLFDKMPNDFQSQLGNYLHFNFIKHRCHVFVKVNDKATGNSAANKTAATVPNHFNIFMTAFSDIFSRGLPLSRTVFVSVYHQIPVFSSAPCARRGTQRARHPSGRHDKRHLQRKCLLYGAAYEARTRYLHLGKVALYQMS